MLSKYLTTDIGIDLGTANTLIYVRGQGIVLNEPSVVAIIKHKDKIQILAVGNDAKKMLGRTPKNIQAVRPLRDGVIADFEIAEAMIKNFVRRALKNRFTLGNPRIVVCVPSQATAVERRAIQESVAVAGARRVYLIEEPIAAALGAGLPVNEAQGSMIVDIGGGTCELGILSLGGIVYASSSRTGGDRFDDAIIRFVRKTHKILIGENTAERIKKDLGCACPPFESTIPDMPIKGRDIVRGVPREVVLSQKDVADALKDPLSSIIEAIRSALEHIAPELAADIADQGIVVSGGGALLRNIDVYIQEEIGIPTAIAEDPLYCVVRGTGKCLDNIEKLKGVFVQSL
ncbi:MAG: rod shape-determining protein [Alphaproteobacteria bacterium GM7ARS4]|nr:rod shape-determining protein [Alphaproteobacteria bacterium GM7ARS4]